MENTATLAETGHGFIVFDPTNVVIAQGYDEYELYVRTRNEDSLDFVYSQKNANRNGLRYIAWKYMVSGVQAREMLQANENNAEFWDEVKWFLEAENYDTCEYC
jgi:hypothetical protein